MPHLRRTRFGAGPRRVRHLVLLCLVADVGIRLAGKNARNGAFLSHQRNGNRIRNFVSVGGPYGDDRA